MKLLQGQWVLLIPARLSSWQIIFCMRIRQSWLLWYRDQVATTSFMSSTSSSSSVWSCLSSSSCSRNGSALEQSALSTSSCCWLSEEAPSSLTKGAEFSFCYFSCEGINTGGFFGSDAVSVAGTGVAKVPDIFSSNPKTLSTWGNWTELKSTS